MPINKARKEFGKPTLSSVKKEMAKPRVAKSAREKYSNLTSSVVLTEAGKPPSHQAGRTHAEGNYQRSED